MTGASVSFPSLDETYPLLGRAVTGVLTTVAPDGRLQVTPVWFLVDGGCVRVSTMREFAKARNMRDRPVATLLVIDPEDASDWVEVRARVRLGDEDGGPLLDSICEQYTGRRAYFGEVVPAELARTEHPVTCRLDPVAIRTPSPVPPFAAAVEPTPPLAATAPRLPPRVGCSGDAPLPADHLDLLAVPLIAAFATRLPNGYPQTHPVWFGRDGHDVLVNTTVQRRKGRNLLADPRATVLVIDPIDDTRWVEIRADVDLSIDDAEQQLDRLTRAYTPHPLFYGHVYPVEQRGRETRVVARLHPRLVHCDALHR